MKVLLLLLSIVMTCSHTYAQSAGEFRSVQSGNWNAPGTWERFSGSMWVAATTTPTSADGVITIAAAHQVTVPAGVSITADELVLTQELIIAVGGKLTLVDGTGTDLTATSATSRLTVNGIFQRNNGSTVDNGATASRVQFASGSQYIHNYTTAVGSLMPATWDPNSTLSIIGFANSATIVGDNSWAQTFGHVIYNCPNQRATVNFAGNLRTILGDFRIQSTGAGTLLQLGAAENYAATIGSSSSAFGGDFIVSGGSRFVLSGAGTATFAVYGDLNFSSTYSTGSNLTLSGSATVDVYGDFIMNAGSAGRIHMTNAGTTGVGTLNIRKNFLLNSGRIDEIGSDPSQGNIRFIGTGNQTFVNNGTIINRINYYIGASSILDVGTSVMSSTTPASFRLDGTLIVGSTDAAGAVQVSAGGNIQTANAYRTYTAGSTIVYRGAGGMFIGSGHPSVAGITTVIDNAAGVKLASALTINGLLQLASGYLDLNNNTFTSGGSVQLAGGMMRGTAASGLVISGTAGGNWGNIVFDPAYSTLATLTMSRTGTNAQATLNNTLVIAGDLNLVNGVLNNISGLRMGNGATITRRETSSITGARPAVSAGDTYNVVYNSVSASYATGLELPASASQSSLGAVQVNPTLAANVITLSQALTINGNVTLTRGSFALGAQTLTMRGAQWNDDGGNLAAGTSTVVFDGVTSLQGSSSTTFNNFTVNAGKTVNVVNPIFATGNINLAATSIFNVGNTTITLNGGQLQTISANGNGFAGLTIAKSGGADVQLLSALNVTGMIYISSPSVNTELISNGFLTLISTTDAAGAGTASVYRLASGNQVTGNVTVQRYMSGEGRIYRYISSPISNAMVSQWKDDFQITGNFLDPTPRGGTLCGYTITPSSPSLFYYDESVAGDDSQGYVGYPLPGNATTNSPLEVGRGYSAFIRQCSLATVIDVTGPINQGSFYLPVTYNDMGSVEADGWNLVGNPYPCSIDWSSTSWTKTRIASVISIIDNASGMTRYYDPGVSNDIPNGRIASGQAFFVRATGASPRLTIREAVKASAEGEFFREGNSFVESFALTLASSDNYDAAFVKISPDALPGLDSLDAPKIKNPTMNFSIVAEDNRAMAISALKGLTCGSQMPLRMEGIESDTYTLTLDTRGFFGQYQFVLIDSYLKKEVVMQRNVSYSFDVTDGSEASKAADRFSLRVLEAPTLPFAVTSPNLTAADAEYSIQLSKSDPNVTYSVWNAQNEQVSEVVPGTGIALTIAVNVANLQEGTNTLEVRGQSACNIFRHPFTVLNETTLGEFYTGVRAFPNPVSEGLTIEVFEDDVNHIDIANVMGQVVTSIDIVPGVRKYTVDLSGHQSGIYVMMVKKGQKTGGYRLLKK